VCLVHQVDGGDGPVETFVGRELEPASRHRPRIFIEGNDTDVEVKAARPNKLEQSFERRLDRSPLDPRHRRLGRPSELGKSPLAQPGAKAALPQDLAGVHARSIRDTYRVDT
jgi:hypothetical protein